MKFEPELYLGDCQEQMKLIEAGTIDMVFTSPPYNLGNSSGGGLKSATGKTAKWVAGAKNLGQGYGLHSDNMEYKDYILWQKECIGDMWNLLSDDGAIFYNHKPRIQSGVLQTPLDLVPDYLRQYVRQIVIWKRSGGFNFNHRYYLPTHEWIVIIAKPNWQLRDIKASGAKDVWEVTQENNSKHPAPFPVELPEIALQTTKAKRILDPFMGSGTTGVACYNYNREFVGIELEPKYFNMAKRRFEDLPINMRNLL